MRDCCVTVSTRDLGDSHVHPKSVVNKVVSLTKTEKNGRETGKKYTVIMLDAVFLSSVPCEE